MRPRHVLKISLLPLLCVLLFAGCAGTVEVTPSPSQSAAPSAQPADAPSPEETAGRTVTLSARFLREDGTPFTQSICLSHGENGMDYPLDEEGSLQISGLPGTGTYTISLWEDDREAGAMTLNLSVGAVIDAATDSDGVGHVTLKEDTNAVSLDFILGEDGALSCSLRLSAEDGQVAGGV